MPEWNGMEDFKNGMEDNLPYFHVNSILDFVLYLQKNTYRCWVVINNIVTEVGYSTSISMHIICRQIAVYSLVVYIAQTVCDCAYCVIVSTVQFNCSIDVTVDDLDRFAF